LRRLGQQVLRWKSVTGFVGEAEAVEPAGGKHDRVETALTPFAETRVDVAAKRLDGKRRLECEQLCAAPDRGGADAHPGTDLVCTTQRVTRIVTLEVRADDET